MPSKRKKNEHQEYNDEVFALSAKGKPFDLCVLTIRRKPIKDELAKAKKKFNLSIKPDDDIMVEEIADKLYQYVDQAIKSSIPLAITDYLEEQGLIEE